MKIAIIAIVLTLFCSARATVVQYEQASFTIPDLMVEMPEAGKSIRAGTTGSRTFVLVDTANGRSLAVSSWIVAMAADSNEVMRVYASMSPEAGAAFWEKHFGKGLGRPCTVQPGSVSADVLAQKVRMSASWEQEGKLFTCKLAMVFFNDRKALQVAVVSPSSQFEAFSGTTRAILDSITTKSQFRLSDPTPDVVGASSFPVKDAGSPPGLTLVQIVFGGAVLLFLIAGPSIYAYVKRKKSRRWILVISILGLFGGGLPGWGLWLWAICGKPEEPSQPCS